jgi:hypothetical protein
VCPVQPKVTCTEPACSGPNATVVLLQTCTSSDPNATLVYFVGGQPAVQAYCPPNGGSLEVQVKPSYPPPNDACPYDTSTAYTLRSEPRAEGRGRGAAGSTVARSRGRVPGRGSASRPLAHRLGT